MIVPLEWLSEYVKLPKNLSDLTDKLTSIGHMLDKTKEVNGHPVIDLELRGNRADMFGVYGVAREVAATLNTELKPMDMAVLPKKDKSCSLVTVEKSAQNLVSRFTAIHLKVKIGPSPAWLVKRLEALDIPSFNNVVDITNYVMMETGEPMHAFDYHKLAGSKLVLRRAKKGEKFMSIQQGLDVTLSDDDLVISDEKIAQSLTFIGGMHSKVSETTTEIILESAVYDSANTRRSSRRLKIFTNGSVRHEKHLDPNITDTALRRALYLLEHLAEAKILSETSDYYPTLIKPQIINFNYSEVFRLTGTDVPMNEAVDILKRLEFGISEQANKLKVTIPTFRTDIEGPADIVEEIIRMYGYDNIPVTPISDAMPEPQTYESFAIQEKLRDQLIAMGFDEAITLSMVPNDWAPDGLRLVNPPDPERATLRTNIHLSLAQYVQRLLDMNQPKVAIFEVGKVFTNKFKEQIHLSMALGGVSEIKSWNSQPRKLTIYELKGNLEKLSQLLGVPNLDYEIGESHGIYWAEVNVSVLLDKIPNFVNPYSIVSQYPPIIEDINISLEGNYDELVNKIKKTSELIKDVQLIDKYGEKLTLRLTFHSDERQLSNLDIAPTRDRLQNLSH